MSKKKAWAIRLILFGIFFTIIFVPYEQWIFRFDEPEKALKFAHLIEVRKIISTVEIGDFAYITYMNEKGTLEEKYVIKDDRGWIPPIKKIIMANKIKVTFEYTIISYPEKKQNFIIITSDSLEKDKLIQNISDNIGTNFKEKSYEYDKVYHRIWIGVIEEYPKDYKIYLDEEEIEL